MSTTSIAVVGLDPAQAQKIHIMLTVDANVAVANVTVVDSLSHFLSTMSDHAFDAVLLGDRGGPPDGLEAIRQLAAVAPAAAIIYCLEQTSEISAAAALVVGAQDIVATGALSGAALAKSVNLGIERAKLRNQLKISNQRLLRLNEEKNRFLGMAAHDLRGPIGNIGGLAEIVISEAEERLGSELVELLRTIERSSTSMVRLIEELLDTSKIESGKLGLNLSRVDLASFLEYCVRQTIKAAARKEIAIEVVCVDDVAIDVDAEKLAQVMENLLSNAVKYSRAGSRVRVEALNHDDGFEIRVQDWGQGIPAADLGHLFDPFYRGTSRPTAGETSTGLGLSIVKGIVAEHRGQVGVTSEHGRGSIFWFKIPQPPVDTASPDFKPDKPVYPDLRHSDEGRSLQ